MTLQGPALHTLKQKMTETLDVAARTSSALYSVTYIFGSPHFDCPVLRGSVEETVPSPLHTGDRLSVSSQDLLTASQHSVPNSYGAVLRATGQMPTLWVPEIKRVSFNEQKVAQVRD